jgi:hypothetical protein
MNWYLTKLVFRIICGDGEHRAQFDEQLRLVAAESKEEAYFKAKQAGEDEEESFLNRRQELVQWRFINVSEVYRLSTLIDGAELYSRIEERDDADSYIAFVNRKADHILTQKTHELLKLA